MDTYSWIRRSNMIDIKKKKDQPAAIMGLDSDWPPSTLWDNFEITHTWKIGE